MQPNLQKFCAICLLECQRAMGTAVAADESAAGINHQLHRHAPSRIVPVAAPADFPTCPLHPSNLSGLIECLPAATLMGSVEFHPEANGCLVALAVQGVDGCTGATQ